MPLSPCLILIIFVVDFYADILKYNGDREGSQSSSSISEFCLINMMYLRPHAFMNVNIELTFS